MLKIHAAANRIPVLRTDSQLRDLPELRDNQPTPLEHYKPHTWSGSIRFSITAKTPLVYGNVDDQTRAISIPTTTLTKAGTTPREVPILPTTMVKGMLSNAFERVTTSRLRVFGDHSEPLTYRMDPAECQQLIPALVLPQQRKVHLLTGTHPRLKSTDDIETYRQPQRYTAGQSQRNKSIPILMAAILRTNPGKETKFAPDMTYEKLLKMTKPKEGKTYRKIHFDAKLVNNGTYAYWFIYALYEDDEEHTRRPIFDEYTLTGEDLQENLTDQTGYTYFTTDSTDLEKHRSIYDKKMSERVFFSEGKPPVVTYAKATTEHLSPIDRYFITLGSYLDNWNDEVKRDPKTERTPNRFVRQHSLIVSNQLKPFFAYAITLSDRSGEKILDTLLPVSIGRNTYQTSPLALAKHTNAAPAQFTSELSPADRLFGYVSQLDKSASTDHSPTSLKGRIFITNVTYSSGKGVGKLFRRLRPLLNPRPSSARRFLTRTDGSNINSTNAKVRRDQYFSHDPEQTLGATTYPVDRNAWDNVDEKTGFPKKALKRASDSLNLTSEVKLFVEAGTKFDVMMRFEALTAFELAWLLWVLDPTNLVPRAEQHKRMSSSPSDKVGYLRLGMGKPLGLGVVRVDLSPNGFRASETVSSNTDTPSLSSAYTDLTGCLGTVVTTTNPAQFHVSKHYLKTPWVEAFQRSCFGYDDALEVRHLTLEENKENNRTKLGLPINGAGVEPGILWGSQSGAHIAVPERRK